MLDEAAGLTPTSRLGCQIILSKELDGLCITLPSHRYAPLSHTCTSRTCPTPHLIRPAAPRSTTARQPRCLRHVPAPVPTSRNFYVDGHVPEPH